MGTDLDAAGRLTGPQYDRHGPALLRVIDVDRQEAAFVIMSVEQRELLMAVDDIAGIVDVERDGCGLARVAIHPCVDQSVGQADHVAQTRSILQPRQGRLGTQIPARVRQGSKPLRATFTRSQSDRFTQTPACLTAKPRSG